MSPARKKPENIPAADGSSSTAGLASSSADHGSAKRERGNAPSTYEAAFDELQHVVQQMEDGGLQLEQALALFDRGTQLADACERLIAQAELRITRLPAESASTLAELSAES